jgi:hypothetical protein
VSAWVWAFRCIRWSTYLAALITLILILHKTSPPPVQVSPQAAARAEQKVEDVEQSVSRGEPATLRLNEAELNSYLNLTLAPQLPPGISELEVHLQKDVIEAQGVVDLDKIPVKPAAATAPWSPLNFVGGRVPVFLRGKLTSSGGFGTFEPEAIRLASLPLPVSVLEQIVAQSTKTKENPQGLDILSPFRLPYAAKRVKLQLAKAVLEF